MICFNSFEPDIPDIPDTAQRYRQARDEMNKNISHAHAKKII